MRRPKGPVRNVWHDVWYARSVKKTTLYLPDELKARVERVAEETRRSEADVIRTAIDQYTNAPRPRPRFPLFESLGEPITDWDEAMRGFGED